MRSIWGSSILDQRATTQVRDTSHLNSKHLSHEENPNIIHIKLGATAQSRTTTQ